MSKRTKVAAFFCVAVLALLGVFAFKSFLSVKPGQLLKKWFERAENLPNQMMTMPDEEEKLISAKTAEDAYLDSNQPERETKLIPGWNTIKPDEDYNVIPDRYNCGAKGELSKIRASDVVNGVTLKESGGINSFDFYKRNTDIAKEVFFDSYDFSDYIVTINNADKIDREIILVFENCEFSEFRSLTYHPKVKLVFRNCTFHSFYGSCAEFEYCKFGDWYSDGIVPFQEVTVRNCYFSNFSSWDEAGTGVHTDGTQIYGKAGMDAENIRYEHCRFEVPSIPGANAINACIMLQMEFSNGINISFNDCICNGGGFTIYASSKNKGFEYYENVVISNIAVGQSRKYGSIYPTVTEGVEISNIYDIDSLYVASVWKQDGMTHLSVTNDTLQERKLLVNADGENYEFTIPASRGGKTDYFDRFEDYPIDLDICIDADCHCVICYDHTSGKDKQIRIATWGGDDSILIPRDEK